MADRTSFSRGDVQAAVAEVWPEASVTDVRPLQEGKNSAYRVAVRNAQADEVALKVGTATPRRISNEPGIIERVRAATDLPVPPVFGTVPGDDPGNPLGFPYFLVDYVPGRTFDPRSDDLAPSTVDRVCYEAGRNLGTLHSSFRFDGVGPLEPTDGELVPPLAVDEWPDVYRGVVRSQLEELDGSRFDDLLPAIEAYADRAADELRTTGAFEPVFTHMDYRLENVKLGTDDRPVTAAILDWGGAAAAPPAYELAHTERILLGRSRFDADGRTGARDRFYEGYAETGGSPPDRSSDGHYRHYRLPARLRVMKHLDGAVEDGPDPDVDARAREHARAVRSLVGDATGR